MRIYLTEPKELSQCGLIRSACKFVCNDHFHFIDANGLSSSVNIRQALRIAHRFQLRNS